jgi:hypothetical protein
LVVRVEKFHSQNRIARNGGFVAFAFTVGVAGHDNTEPRHAHSRGHAARQVVETTKKIAEGRHHAHLG